MFHHILFPIDFSERCKQVAPLIRALANRYRADVTLMHVFQIPAGWYGGMEGTLPAVFDLEAMERDASGLSDSTPMQKDPSRITNSTPS